MFTKDNYFAALEAIKELHNPQLELDYIEAAQNEVGLRIEILEENLKNQKELHNRIAADIAE